MERMWDCIVVGGGAAGLSAALVLGRARRRTLVIDAGAPSNLAAHGIGGLLGHNGRPSAELYAAGRAELAAHPSVEVRTGIVMTGSRVDGRIVLELAGGRREVARRVVLATGMEYRRPDVRGLEERWGGSVFHCPFCHGWEVRERPLGVLDNGPNAVHRALLLRAWTDDVTLFTDGPAELSTEERAVLEAARVALDERPVVELLGPGGALSAVAFDDGDQRACEGLLVPVTLHQRSKLATELGAEAAPPGPVAADAIDVDAMLQTSAPGVLAAGDVSTQMPSVANAIAAGSNAAMSVVRSLVAEDFGRA